MPKSKKTDQIKKLVNSLINLPPEHEDVEIHLKEIHTLFQKITGITGNDFKVEYLAAIPTAKGKALGLNHAAQCLLDYKRTSKFLKAIISAIVDKQQENPGQPIKIFYAGCGPYAPFASLVAPLFHPKEVQFSLLEINENSFKSAKKLIAQLKLTHYIDQYYLADAVTFTVPAAESYDLLISETLDALLYRECYVPILINMIPQFQSNLTVIPENVILNLKILTPVDDNGNRQEHDIEHIVDVRESISTFVNTGNNLLQLPDKKIDLSSLDMDKYESILIDTTVHIYKNIQLTRNESSLTLPFEMMFAQPFEFNTLVFTYHLEPEVELKYRLE